MQKKLIPLHYVLVTMKGNGEEKIEIYDGAHTERALNARLKKERCDGDQWAKMYRLLRLWCSPDGAEIWGNYENIEHPEDVQFFAVIK